MKYSIIRIAALAAAVLGIVSCEKDEPDARSIFPVDNSVQTEFDAWLMRHFVEPYNIRYEYKMPDRETNFGYWVSPPPVEKAIEIAKLVKFSTLDAMAEMMSTGSMDEDPTLFAKKFFPKVLFVVGSFEISNTGTTNLASAENGLQINILGAKFFDRKIDSERIAGTMLHEFTHILDGTYPVPSEYKTVTASDYVGSRYTSLGNDYLQHGFVSNYARSSVAEDIAETGGRLISADEATWEAWLEAAGEDGRAKLEKKRLILKNWLMESFGVDSDKWREVYLRRVAELDNIDWTNLDD